MAGNEFIGLLCLFNGNLWKSCVRLSRCLGSAWTSTKVTENDVSRLRPTSRKFWQRLSNRKRFSHQTASAQGFARYGVGKIMASKGQQSSIHDLQMYEHFTGCVECQSILTNSASAMYSRSVSSTNWQNDVLKAFQNAIFVHHDHDHYTPTLFSMRAGVYRPSSENAVRGGSDEVGGCQILYYVKRQ